MKSSWSILLLGILLMANAPGVSAGEKTEIKWRAWEKAAFELAKSKKKPIILDITATWCHWCIVMDENSYSDPQVIDLINQNYVPIRVDADRRPDIVNRYSAGGFPTTSFLMPNGEIITSATYVPVDPLIKVLIRLKDFVKKNPAGQEIARGYIRPQEKPVSKLEKETIGAIEDKLNAKFDTEHGGFGKAPKFPTPEINKYLLHRYLKTKEKKYLDMAQKNLDHMYTGGLFDPVGLGFFRYSTTTDWSVPHFEKMLNDNAALLSNYLLAYQVTGNKVYREVAKKTIKYLLDNLYDEENGVFFNSQAADEKYYLLDAKKRKAETAPPVDKTVLTNNNALTIRAFLHASLVFNEKKYRYVALKNIEYLLENMPDKKKGFAHFYDEKPQTWGIFDDNLGMVEALLDAYEYTGKRKYLDEAEKLWQIIDRLFYDPKEGKYLDTRENEGVGYLPIRFASLPENARAARALIRYTYYQMAESSPLYQQAVNVLRSMGNEHKVYGIQAAIYGDALVWHWDYPLKAVIVGDPQQVVTQKLAKEFQRARLAYRITLILDPQYDKEKLETGGYPALDKPAIYICYEKGCLPPITDPQKIAPAIKNLSSP